MLYDVLNQITIDAQIESYASSERDLLEDPRKKVDKGAYCCLIKGITVFGCCLCCRQGGIEFCVRLKENWWLKVKEFAENSEKERMVSFSLPKKDRKKLSGFPNMQDTTITCRLIKVELPYGDFFFVHHCSIEINISMRNFEACIFIDGAKSKPTNC